PPANLAGSTPPNRSGTTACPDSSKPPPAGSSSSCSSTPPPAPGPRHAPHSSPQPAGSPLHSKYPAHAAPQYSETSASAPRSCTAPHPAKASSASDTPPYSGPAPPA